MGGKEKDGREMGGRGEKRERRGYDEIQRGCGVVWKIKRWFGNNLTVYYTTDPQIND
jgi:uncharacterized protein YydD (DUF2326 family)